MKRIIVVCCGLGIILAGIWAYVWWQSPSETKEFTAADQTIQGVLGSETTLAVWQTKYFSTRYPTSLKIITSNEVAHGMTTGQYLLGSVSFKQTDQLAVTVGPLQGMVLTELPAIKLRQQQPDTYQSAMLPIIPSGGVAFQSTDGYETAVFWQHNARYAAVVVSGSSTRQAELNQALESVVANWQWK